MVLSRIGWLFSVVLSLTLPLSSCGHSRGDDGEAPPATPAACAPGELGLPDGSCQPAGLPPSMPCSPGERALPDGRCQPAGVPREACAAGRFLPDDRGGCEAILPAAACSFGQMAVPGESVCREVAPCGEGPWNAAIPADAAVEYVDATYPGADSDGSRERPWTTVGAAVAAASPGGTVAVAAGRYTEDVWVTDKPVRLWGLCPAQTELVGPGSGGDAVTFSGASTSGSEVRGLAVTGPRSGIVVQGARSVVIDEVWVHDAAYVGVAILDGASVTVSRALVERNTSMGVLSQGADVTVEETVVRATRFTPGGQIGWGIGVGVDARTRVAGTLSLTSSLVEQSAGAGVMVMGSEATISATVVRETGSEAGGIDVQLDTDAAMEGRLSLTTSVVEQSVNGVLVNGSEATIDATVVRATRRTGAGKGGAGILVLPREDTGEGGKLSLTTSLIEDNESVGLFVDGAEATVGASVLSPEGPEASGSGIVVQPHPDTLKGGRLSLTASRVEGGTEFGVSLLGSAATIEATVVRATRSNHAGELGRGINVQSAPDTGQESKLSLKASLIEDSRDSGMVVSGSEATIEATVVRATQPDTARQRGDGIVVQADLVHGVRGRLSLKASRIEENHEVGVLVLASDAAIEATLVRGTKRPPGGREVGDGILVADIGGRSSATIAATMVADNARVGVLYMGSTGELSFTRCSGNRFGVVVQRGTTGEFPTFGDGNDFAGNTERDRISDGELPVPDVAAPLP